MSSNDNNNNEFENKLSIKKYINDLVIEPEKIFKYKLKNNSFKNINLDINNKNDNILLETIKLCKELIIENEKLIQVISKLNNKIE